ncbi:MAG: PilZ domain-containing protein, partial [Candidatus Manganitrophaceae bacterium]
NIAWGGIGGYTRDSIDEGIKIRAEFFFTLRSGQVLSEKLPGKIAWTHRDGNFNAFGIAFSELDPAAHPRLISYLQYIDQTG